MRYLHLCAFNSLYLHGINNRTQIVFASSRGSREFLRKKMYISLSSVNASKCVIRTECKYLLSRCGRTFCCRVNKLLLIKKTKKKKGRRLESPAQLVKTKLCQKICLRTETHEGDGSDVIREMISTNFHPYRQRYSTTR